MAKKKKRTYDWDTARFRHFLIKFAYNGTNYHGIAYQPETNHPNKGNLPDTRVHVNTVEKELLDVLEQGKIIKDRHTCRFSRCGRTDKGVHAAGNYISLDLRVSPHSIIPGLLGRADRDVDVDKNIDYCKMMNAMLPADIRILSVDQVPDDFDARFSCLYRRYEYYFLKRNLNIKRMEEAAQHFIGTKDFTNFCKMDIANARDFKRTVLSFEIKALDDGLFAVARIDGMSFLWHQVRCMMAVLMYIGEGLEDVNLIETMLDVSDVPRKPQYELAPECGLILKDCFFDLECHTNKKTTPIPYNLFSDSIFNIILSQHVMKSLNSSGPFDKDYSLPFPILPGRSKYVKLLDRQREKTFEEKVATYRAAMERKEIRTNQNSTCSSYHSD